jgi:gluconokinase
METMSNGFPRSPYDREGGLVYFPRMVEKIRLHQSGELPDDYQANLGAGFDLRCCDFLHVDYDALAEQARAGKSDAEVLEWCFENGRRPSEDEIFMWNEYLRKCGWNDHYSERLRTRLEGLGMADRTDIRTMFDLIEVDEGREPGGAKAAGR